MTDEVLGRFRADLRVEPVVKDGAARAFRVTDPFGDITHVLTDVEYAVARELDGTKTASAVAVALASRGMTVSAKHVESFARELEGMSFVLRVDDVPAPPPLPPPPAPTPPAAGDTARLVEEAKRALAAGDLRAARDHIDAALALKSPPAMPAIESAALPPRTEEYPRILMTSPPAPPASTSSPPPAPAAIASPDAPTTSPTVERQPAADSIGIDIDVAEQLAPRRRGRTPLLLAAAVVVVAAVAFVALSPSAPLHAFFVREPAAPVAEVPRPSPPPPATPPDAAPAPSTPTPAPIPTPAPVDATKASTEAAAAAPETAAALDVVAPMRGKFAKVYVAKGVHVKRWQVLGLLVDVAGDKQAPLTAPGDGVFEAIVPLGSKLKKGDVVARVTPP